MVSPYLPTLYRRARGLTGNAADAQDVSQETVLKAWSRLGQFAGKQDDPIDDFRAWISRIAANTSIDLLRQRRDGNASAGRLASNGTRCSETPPCDRKICQRMCTACRK